MCEWASGCACMRVCVCMCVFIHIEQKKRWMYSNDYCGSDEREWTSSAFLT